MTGVGADAASALVWGAVTFFLVWTCWRISMRLAPDETLSARALRATVLCWAVLVGASTLLGVAGVLIAPVLVGFVGLVSLLLWWLSRPEPVIHSPSDKSGFLLWAGLIAFWSGYIVLQGLGRFPSDWDTLMYHLPLVNQWLQAQSLYAPRDAIWYNAGNNELVGLWIVAPFSGDFLIALNNLPATTVLVLAGMELGKDLGLPWHFTLLCGLALAGNHVVFQQLTDAENDVAVAGLFLTVLCYACRYTEAMRSADLFCAAIAIGLLAGVKYYALGYAAVAGAFLVLRAYQRQGISLAVRALAASAGGAILFGGYWYIRNTCLTGTPIYPKGLTANTDLLSQGGMWHGGIWTTTLLGSGRAEVLPLTIAAVQGIAGPCHLVAFLILPVTTIWLLLSSWSVRGRSVWQAASMRPALILALLGSGLIWGITPWTIENDPGTLNMLIGKYSAVRYGLAFLSLNLIAFLLITYDVQVALRAASAKLIRRRQAARLVTFASYVPFLLAAAGSGYAFAREVSLVMVRAGLLDALLISGNVVLIGANLALILSLWRRARPWLLSATFAGLLVAFAGMVELRARAWHAGFCEFYDLLLLPDAFSELARRDPARTCICPLTYRYYPYVGSRRQFRVARPHRQLSYERFRDYLLSNKVTVIVPVSRDSSRRDWYHDPVKWVMERPAIFRKITGFEIYEVDLEKLRNSGEGDAEFNARSHAD